MSVIQPNHQLSWAAAHKTQILAAAAGALLLTAAVSAIYLAISTAFTVNFASVVSYTIFSAEGTSGIAVFIFSLYQHYRKKSVPEPVTIAPPKTPDVAPTKIPEPVPAIVIENPANIEQKVADIPTLFNNIKETTCAFAKGYYTSKGKNFENSQAIIDCLGAIENEVEDLLKHPDEVLCTAVGLLAALFTDTQSANALFEKSEQEIVVGLQNIFKAPEKKYEALTDNLKEFIQQLTNQSTMDKSSLKLIKAVKTKYKAMAKASEDVKAKAEYSVAFYQLIDHLFNSNLTQEERQTCLQKIIPSLLELGKELFIDKICEILLIPANEFKKGEKSYFARKKSLVNGVRMFHSPAYPKIKRYIERLPLKSARHEALKVAAFALFPLLIDAVYYGFFEENDAYRKEIEKIVKSSDFAALGFETHDWQGILMVICGFFEKMTTKLQHGTSTA